MRFIYANQQGKIAVLPAVIIGALSIGLMASIYLNINVSKHAQDEMKLMQGEITDLRYQVKKDQLAQAGVSSSSPSPKPSANPSPSPSATPTPSTILGAQSLAIAELGVKMTLSDPLADMSYEIIPSQTAGALVAGIKSASFSAKYPKCTPGSALGQIVRRPSTQKAPSSNVFIASIGEYKYYYYTPGSSCAPGSTGKADVDSATAALQTKIFKTLAKID